MHPLLLFWESTLFLSSIVLWKQYLGPGTKLEQLLTILPPIVIEAFDLGSTGWYVWGPGDFLLLLANTYPALHSLIFPIIHLCQLWKWYLLCSFLLLRNNERVKGYRFCSADFYYLSKMWMIFCWAVEEDHNTCQVVFLHGLLDW